MSTEFRGDWNRAERTGIAEAVFAESKTVGQLETITRAALDAGRPMLFTRMSAAQHEALEPALRAAIDYCPQSRTGMLGRREGSPPAGKVCVVAAGTSDMPVAAEAVRTLAFNGVEAALVADVGVAGLWRLLDQIEFIRGHDVIIAVAGMEGALFSVLGGLVDALVIAVPSSVGYGVAANGEAAMRSALASCAPGLVTVNVDNGFGAACAALKVLRRR